MSKHTPGPWKQIAGEPTRIIGPRLEHIADVYYTNAENKIANARLIAAAPGLLRAASWALREMRIEGNRTDWPYGMSMNYAHAMNALKSAIEKTKENNGTDAD